MAAPVWSVIVDHNSLNQWLGEYANAFVACGRGESETASLLAYHGVPLLLTTPNMSPSKAAALGAVS